MLQAIWNWIKNLFFSCCPIFLPEPPMQVTDSLLIADNQNMEDDLIPASGNNAQQNRSSSQLIADKLNQPISLTTDESDLVICHALRGENDYIDKLSIDKQHLAYQLIMSKLNERIVMIDTKMEELHDLNNNANRLEISWRRVRSDFLKGDSSQYSIIPICNDFKIKYIDYNNSRGASQIELLDKIIATFNICKILLMLKISRRHHTNQLIAYTPTTAAETEDDFIRTETKMNAKTLKLLSSFNKRNDEYAKENPPSEPRKRKGKLFGYS